MPRRPRTAPGGLACHVINRSSGNIKLFRDAADYQAFEKVLAEARERCAMRVCAYILLPTHFHLVLWPSREGQLSRFMQWLSMTHTQRWHARHHNAGRGHLYQSRFKSFLIEHDAHFLSVCRYVERNALRAKLVKHAEDWMWSSLACREQALEKANDLLDDWPVERPRRWQRLVNRPQSQQELEAVRLSVRRGRPYGDDNWTRKTAARLDLASTLRPVGRPKKPKRGE
ncbi:MAG: transposase [Planctomycetota bacterium]|nr:transposase [Planctomycetota bacterium]